MDRRAVPVGNDHLPEFGGVLELTVGLDRRGLVWAPKGARRQTHVLRTDRCRHFVDTDAAVSERRRIQLHTHGVLLRAVNLYLCDARHHRDALRQICLTVLVEIRQGHSLRRQSEKENWRIGRVNLAV